MKRFEIVIGIDEEDVEDAASTALRIEELLCKEFSAGMCEVKYDLPPLPSVQEPVKFASVNDMLAHQRDLARRSIQALVAVGLPGRSRVVQEWKILQHAVMSERLDEELLQKEVKRTALTNAYAALGNALDTLKEDLAGVQTALDDFEECVEDVTKKASG
jgi:hypothetical protein